MKNYWKFLTIACGLLLIGSLVYGQVADAPAANGFNWWSVVQIALGAVTTFFAGAWAWVKDRAGKLANASKELYDVFHALETALADDTVTKEEAQNILAESKEALAAVKVLVGKKA